MTSAPAPTRTRLIDPTVFGLCMACPITQDNPVTCPLHEIRKRSLAERAEWVCTRSEGEMAEIKRQHSACERRKLEGQVFSELRARLSA